MIDPIEQARRELAPKSSFLDAHEAHMRHLDEVKAASEKLKAKMAPPGSFNLPPLLEERRWQHLIPNGAFHHQPLYDWCFVYQTARYDMTGNETWGETSIVKTQTAQKLGEQESPRGILVAAGLAALDTLSSHGICIGDYVFMIRNAPWEIEIDVLGAKKLCLRVLRDADLLAGEDLQKRINDGVLTVKSKVNADGQRIHYYETKDGKPLNPVTPHIPDDL